MLSDRNLRLAQLAKESKVVTFSQSLCHMKRERERDNEAYHSEGVGRGHYACAVLVL